MTDRRGTPPHPVAAPPHVEPQQNVRSRANVVPDALFTKPTQDDRRVHACCSGAAFVRPNERGTHHPGPVLEHDACGVGFVADLNGRRGHDIVEKALTVLRNLDHRGAAGADPDDGDRAGILTQVPHDLYTEVCDFTLPDAGAYATGIGFLPADETERAKAVATIDAIVADEGLTLLGWRDVPTEPHYAGPAAREAMPHFGQLFITGTEGTSTEGLTGIDLERYAYCVRKRAEHETDVYFPSLSRRTIAYKGMLTTPQLEPFFPDLSDRRYTSGLGLVHSRFSTNTFPSWPLAHPFRDVAHNGEINTVKGNRNMMRSREAKLASALVPGDLDRLFPIVDPEDSDTASFDDALELLHLGGRSLPHAVLMMIPEPWEKHTGMDPSVRAFYEYHSTLMEPWDGPASVSFTDGTVVGSVLDRNGLRPGRYWVTDDGLVVLASEAGVLDIDPATVVRKGRLQPGRIFVVDTEQGRIVEDEEIKAELAAQHPYREWVDNGITRLGDLPLAGTRPGRPDRPRPADLRLHRGRTPHHPHADGPHRRRTHRLHGHRHPGRGPLRPLPADLRLL